MALKDRDQYNAYMREYMLKRYHQRRDRAIQMLGGSCSRCTSTKNLQFDHVDPSTKEFPISKLWSVSEKRFLAEIVKCQILCDDCHRLKTRTNGDIAKGRARERARRGG